MTKYNSLLILFAATFLLTTCSQKSENTLKITGLREAVEVIRDSVGINHIYAKNQHDLFFAQGYCAAKDRLFQFEIWRRQASGTVSEILGERELKRDIGTRLFKFRGDIKKEMNHYHDEGEEIITAYVEGVNAYIEEALKSPATLPIEFKILNILPAKWTPEIVISRHQGLLGNITYELDYGRAVAKVGVEKVKEVMWFHPQDPDLTLDPSFTKELLSQDILELYNAYRDELKFLPEDVAQTYRNESADKSLSTISNKNKFEWSWNGSNNWAISGVRTQSGLPILANDPHRKIAIPSLRYMVHLVAPGWNVIGGGEPEIPGISIGHNEYGAWGLTVFETDGEDLLVYDLNPDNLNQYKYNNSWKDFDSITDTIPVKNQNSKIVELKYSQHGPVTFIDTLRKKAFAVRCAWLEPGGSPYLASLRMDQAKNWEEFREACKYSHIPGENMVWADKKGNIGWQAVGIAPIRKNYSGLVPVPGDGRFEWDGYLPILEKPNAFNPPSGFIATANENITPSEYKHWNAIGYEWADPYRGMRISNTLAGEKKFSVADMQRLQTDYYSIPASHLVPMLKNLTFNNQESQEAQQLLQTWNYELSPTSIEATIYVQWETELKNLALEKFVPNEIHDDIYLQMFRLLEWLEKPGKKFGQNPIKGRDEFLSNAFQNALAELKTKLGPDKNKWQYGQAKYKHSYVKHTLSELVSDSLKKILNTQLVARGGNGLTVGSTGSNLNQSSGASFRIIVDLSDWDNCWGTNPPGQSGNPESPFYKNLLESWGKDEFFRVCYTDSIVRLNQTQKVKLIPEK